MLKRVNEILIGKNIGRTIGDSVTVDTYNQTIVNGEVLVVDANFTTVDATPSYADTEVIYIVEGTDEVRTYTTPSTATAVTAFKLITSNPIDGNYVKAYNKVEAVAKTEKIATFAAISDTIVAGTEYVLRIVYKDVVEDPGQFTETYRYIAKTGDASTDVFNGIRARIVKNIGRLSIRGGARVVGSGTTTLILTGKPIPECTSTVYDIDELTMVDFEAFLNYVDNDGVWTGLAFASASPVYTAGVRGSGVWEVIRDVEKHALSYKGIDNRIWFPVAMPVRRTVRGSAYNTFVIEHDTSYRSADNQYNKETSLTTIIAVDDGVAALHQGLAIQTALDAWMGTLPHPKVSPVTLIFPIA